jgi:hydrogenase/urease accessory protein HupE
MKALTRPATLARCVLRLPRAIQALVLAWLLGLGSAAHAHEMTMVDLTVREATAGDFIWSWGVPGKGRPVAEDLDLHWPEHCQTHGQAVRCGAQGLVGPLAIDGLGKAYSAVILRLYWRGGATQTITLTGAQPSVHLLGGASDTRGAYEIARAYAVLGVEHILSGWDHLLFVISLLLLVGFNRRLVATVTAFTLAHSLTLGLSALGWLSLRSPPVEATIALSILLVCSEALGTQDSLARRWPALVAFIFGLVHGLGFAGALREIGLPEQHLFVALLTFNLGVEAGQLLVLLVCWLIGLAAHQLAATVSRRNKPSPSQGAAAIATARSVLLYGIGSIAAYWSIERLMLMLLR